MLKDLDKITLQYLPLVQGTPQFFEFIEAHFSTVITLIIVKEIDVLIK